MVGGGGCTVIGSGGPRGLDLRTSEVIAKLHIHA
jgi:hypothetical protein